MSQMADANSERAEEGVISGGAKMSGAGAQTSSPTAPSHPSPLPAPAQLGLAPGVLSEALALCVHDLRNPLSAIYSDTLYLKSSAPLDADGREVVTEVIAACDAIGHIIENLALIGESLSGGPALPLRRFELSPLVKEVVESMARTAQGYRVKLSSQAPPADTAVLSHTELLARALANLLRNAIENAPEGTRVSVVPEQTNTHAFIHIRDEALGVPAKDDDIFSLESQVKAKRRHERYGRGLGLYCAATAAKQAGAEVSFAAGPPHVLTLSIPLATG